MRPAATLGDVAHGPRCSRSQAIADFRKDNGAAIKKVCARFVELCRQMGLLAKASVAIDGSKFKAVNNRDKNFTTAKVEKRRTQLEASIARYLSQLDTADLHRKIGMPLLVLWGGQSSVGRRFADPLEHWRRRAHDVRGEALPTGHYINEEAPRQVVDWFVRFFGS